MSIKLNSDHDETRTRITPIRSRVLYPVKLRDLVHNGNWLTNCIYEQEFYEMMKCRDAYLYSG